MLARSARRSLCIVTSGISDLASICHARGPLHIAAPDACHAKPAHPSHNLNLHADARFFAKELFKTAKI